jgi:hypothetical protein
LAQRVRIVLLAADGLANTEIATRVRVSRPTVTGWRPSYERSGIGGLSEARSTARFLPGWWGEIDPGRRRALLDGQDLTAGGLA